MYTDAKQLQADVGSVNLGKYAFTGQKYKDQMCLRQTRNDRTQFSGGYCLPSMEFLMANSVIGDFEANGVLGLAPSGPITNYVQALKENGAIDKAIVGLNYENPMDTSVKSQITIGAINFAEIHGGEDGLNYYSNLAINKWGLLMDDFLYNGIDMTGDHKAKIALIDSGNTSIQIPASMFQATMAEMKKVERSIYSTEVDGATIMVARTPCSDLYDKMADITFDL